MHVAPSSAGHVTPPRTTQPVRQNRRPPARSRVDLTRLSKQPCFCSFGMKSIRRKRQIRSKGLVNPNCPQHFVSLSSLATAKPRESVAVLPTMLRATLSYTRFSSALVRAAARPWRRAVEGLPRRYDVLGIAGADQHGVGYRGHRNLSSATSVRIVSKPPRRESSDFDVDAVFGHYGTRPLL